MARFDDFEWDDAKAALNARQHGIGFEAVALLFRAVDLLEDIDDREDYGEDRWLAIGPDRRPCATRRLCLARNAPPHHQPEEFHQA